MTNVYDDSDFCIDDKLIKWKDWHLWPVVRAHNITNLKVRCWRDKVFTGCHSFRKFNTTVQQRSVRSSPNSSPPTVCLLLQIALKSSSKSALNMSLRHMFSSWLAAATNRTAFEARSHKVVLLGSSGTFTLQNSWKKVSLWRVHMNQMSSFQMSFCVKRKTVHTKWEFRAPS